MLEHNQARSKYHHHHNHALSMFTFFMTLSRTNKNKCGDLGDNSYPCLTCRTATDA